ncbi:MAG: hypothetical protein EP330_15500 [Deltaproteobacteria bacterium]|nr:MAG: hypothetical protein EP330_15500 [Deltaproteobacteria bacterium]
MKPSLPQDDPRRPLREQQLAEARESYAYDRSVAGLLFVEKVPLRDHGGAEYWAKLAAANAETVANRLASNTREENLAELRAGLGEIASKLTRDQIHFGPREGDVPSGYPMDDPDHFARSYKLLREPTTLDNWADDDLFAYRAIAGDFPCTLTCLDAVPDKLALNEERFDRVAGDDHLADAIAEGRVYVIDHARFDGAVGGVTDGYQKYLDAPIGVYAWTRDGRWVVIGIQAGQDPEKHGFFQPGDGVSWKMAKLSHACADSQVAGLQGHFGLCHVVVESIAIAARCCLASMHPLRLLLDAHTENTLIVNEITKNSLTPPGGAVDRSMSMRREDSLALTLEAVEAFRIMDSAPHEDFARRGVDDVATLPEYPYRDDQLLLWDAIATWVEAYVHAYYADDAAVTGDEELQAFVAELQAPDQGGLHGIGDIATRDRLVHLLQRLVFRCSAYHAAINYALYDQGYAPLEPCAQFGPGPTGNDSEDDYLRMLTPYAMAYETIEAFYPLQVRINRLGEYPYIRDEAVHDALLSYRSKLVAIESEIEVRNGGRLMPYTVCLPSRVSNSVHV